MANIMDVHHCIIKLNIDHIIEEEFVVFIELIFGISFAFKMENHIKYSGHDTSSALGIIWSISHVNDWGFSIFWSSSPLLHIVDEDSLQNNSICIGLSILVQFALKIFFRLSFTELSIFELLDIICEGNDHAAANEIVEISITAAVKNQLTWIHIAAISNHNKLFFNVDAILSFHEPINHLNIIYTK